MLQRAKYVIPPRARPLLRRAWSRIAHFGFTRRCPVCGSFLRTFAPHGVPAEQEAVCPVCRSKAPHRLAYLVFAQRPKLFRAGGLFVHIAPEPELAKRLKDWASRHGMQYRSGAINGVGEHFLDIRHLPYPDGSIDLIYCCHVLNAMQEDLQAMREVHRVLHPQGSALLQVPAFHFGLETLETNSRAERLAHFHDDGIYRCYTDVDYIHRLQQAGFDVERVHASDFPPARQRSCGLKSEVLHICRRAAEQTAIAMPPREVSA